MRKIIFLLLLAIAGTIAFLMWSWSRPVGTSLQSAVVEQVARNFIPDTAESSLVPKVLGFEQPQTYLVLFLNNTEIRPGGGFIGAYSVVRFTKGVPEILKVEGTEILDNNAPKDFVSVPPEPLQKFLKIDRLSFRDSNWSPDFASSSVAALDLFKKEKGISADEIDGVIGITPTFIEELIKITGPITVGSEQYTAENFTEKLEYEVEYGFVDQGLNFDERKKVLNDLSHALLARLRTNVFKNIPQYMQLVQRMFEERHVMAYAQDGDVQKVIEARGWSGEMKSATTSADYILWTDANMAALKTDKVMQRELSYSIAPSGTEQYVGTIAMKYINTGSFTKFTTRYRTYVRLFVPEGSQFISVTGSMKTDRSAEPGTVDTGVENGRRWFGTFISIEPGKTGVLKWKIYLSPRIGDMIRKNYYSLDVQKQLGTIRHALTLDLNFGKDITSAVPEKEIKNQKQYMAATDLSVDRSFYLQFESAQP
jgi:hypothetical protein